MKTRIQLYTLAAGVALLSLCTACSENDAPGNANVPKGMVEVKPVLAGLFSTLDRIPGTSRASSKMTRTYDDNSTTNGKLNETIPLPDGSTVWLIARNADATAKELITKKSYIVYNDASGVPSYLYPCTVDDNGKVTSMSDAPLYLKNGDTYTFSAISPARKLDIAEDGTISFNIYNGDYFYANDCRYAKTTPSETIVGEGNTSSEQVQVIELKPMMNQTAQLKFQIKKGDGVHSLEILSSGVEISGLQNDDKGVNWHMSQTTGDEPIELKHGDKTSAYTQYNYTTDTDGNFIIDAGVIPMYSISKPLIVLFNMKVNGIPTTYEMMLNEKDLKAGYSYGYRGVVKVEAGVTVMTWQTVSWETDIELPNQ